jgi:predicted lipoprotein with Yx(FWY)xxD motif
MFRKTMIAAGLLGVLAAGSAMAQTMPAAVGNTAKGKSFTDSHGMTLYTFAKDPAGKSVCNGACAKNWPPFMASAGAAASGDWSMITRKDGSMQWAYKGKPLYAFAKDTAPGDIKGNGLLKGAWRIARP